MPTGYTAPIAEGQDITFEQFTWRCARAFGALIMMRDEPMDAPIPERFEPCTEYHTERIREAEERLPWLRSLNPLQAADHAEADYLDRLRCWKDGKNRCQAQENRYRAMLAQVVAWEPPTAGHAGLRDFMVQQLEQSISHDCYQVEPPERMEGSIWLTAEIAEAEYSLEYHTARLREEIERVAARNQWLAELRESVPPSRG